jgi:glutathione S-transferase
MRWADGLGIDLGGLANLAAFRQRMDADPGVQKALKEERLDQAA